MGNIPQTLVNALLDGWVVPFVGAGVSRSLLKRDNPSASLFPGWKELLEQAAVQIDNDGKAAEAMVVRGLIRKRRPNYLEAARYALQGMGPLFWRFLKEKFDPPRDAVDEASLELPRLIWGLASGLIITTNYDRVLDWACADQDLDHWDIQSSAELAALLRKELKRKTVWHLHGTVSNTAHLILTPDGYQKLYADSRGEAGYQAALQALRHLLVARTLLFIGFSFDDQHFGEQLALVHEVFEGTAGPHYLLIRDSEFDRVQEKLANLPIELLRFGEFKDLPARLRELIACRRGPCSASAQSRTDLHAGANDPDTQSAAPVPDRVGNLGKIPHPPRDIPTADAEKNAAACLGSMNDVRSSYRRVYTFQRRIFDCLTTISDGLKKESLQFDRWDPLHFSRPPRSTTEFFRRSYWAWDFLPAYGIGCTWQTESGIGMTGRRVVLEIEPDTGFSKRGGEPDPIYFGAPETARSELWVSLFSCNNPSVSWVDVWKALGRERDLYDDKDHAVELAGGERAVFRFFSIDLELIVRGTHFENDKAIEAHVLSRIHAWFKEQQARL